MRNDVDELLFDRVKQYAVEKHECDLHNILASVNQDHFSVTIHFVLLLEVCPMACEAILANSAKYFPLFDSALVEAANEVYENTPRANKSCLVKKKFIHFRVIGLPLSPDIDSSTMPKLKDNGKFLCIQGTVIKSSQPKILEYQKEYACSKCNFEFLVSADYDQYYSLKLPTSCPSPKRCKNTKFQPVNKGIPQHRKDYQEVKVQEPLNKLGVGTIPSSIWVTLEDDLVDQVTPGDDVTICGLVSYRWMPVVRNQRATIEVVLKANSILVNNNAKVSSKAVNDDLMKQFRAFWLKHSADPLSGRNIILSSFAPQIYGMFLVKLATAIVICGGVTRHDDSGIKSRGESHLLLIGDPGAGKSQILKYVSKLCSRSVLTTGIGTTSAGLTVSASKESGTWHLEAGALVMADGGICCIDEFSSIQEKDRASIHEAMEQQTISIAKAGMVCKLNTRCTIIAATNPKGGRYDSSVDLNINAGLATPLLTRFDLIMILADKKDATWDEIVAEHILNQNAIVKSQNANMWSFEEMKSYFSLVKSLKPILTNEANDVLCKYYFALRQAAERQMARTTVRMFESLIRLAQGHARLMFREKVTLMDAVVVITIMESSMQTGSLLNCENSFHSAFPMDPMEEYYKQARLILDRLSLRELIPKLRNDANLETSIFGFKNSEGQGLRSHDESIGEKDLAASQTFSQFNPTCKENTIIDSDEEQNAIEAVERNKWSQTEDLEDIQPSSNTTRKRKVSDEYRARETKKKKLNEEDINPQQTASPDSLAKKIPPSLFMCADNDANDEDFEL